MKSASSSHIRMDYSELHGFTFEDLKLGMSATMSRTITKADLLDFSHISGDNNPVHLNEQFAQKTPFGKCIAHGMLSASLISAVIGTKLPGPGCIYMNQTLRFLAPVYVGDIVIAVCKIKELFPEKKRVLLDTKCYVKSMVVIDGDALIKL